MRPAIIVALVTAAVASGGCLVLSLQPAYDAQSVGFDEALLGIWVNADSRVFEDSPAYFAVLSNRPLDLIASSETLRRLQIGLDNIPLLQRASVNIAEAGSDDPFRIAFIKIKSDEGLYSEVSNGVTFLAPALFRASIPLPADVPVGTYEVDVRLFADGAQIARTPAPFEVYKFGIEQTLTINAREHGILVEHFAIGAARTPRQRIEFAVRQGGRHVHGDADRHQPGLPYRLQLRNRHRRHGAGCERGAVEVGQRGHRTDLRRVGDGGGRAVHLRLDRSHVPAP